MGHVPAVSTIAAPPTVLAYIIEGSPVPAQMGAMIKGRDGTWITAKSSGRLREFKDRVRLLTSLRVRAARWECGPDEMIALTLRAFIEDARVIDLDNICKSTIDCLKRVAFPDDRQVTELHATKAIDRARPRLEIEIVRIS